MAYEPKTWVCGETITAEALNHMENGIEAVQPMILTFGGTTQEEADDALVQGARLNATWQEINDAFRAGRRIVAIANPYFGELLGDFAIQVLTVGNGTQGAMYFGKPEVVVSWSGQDARTLTCDTVNDYPQMSMSIG